MPFNRQCVSPFILAALIFLSACSGETKSIVVDKSETTLLGAQGLRVYKDKPLSGDMVTRHPSGELASSEKYEQGKRHGHLKKWFNNGQLGFESNYSNGKIKGVTRSWWNNGNLRSETPYQDGKVHGISLLWYESGERFKKMRYLNGKPTGLQQAWRQNGKLFSNYEYKNGRVFGLKKANMCFGLENEKLSVNN